MNSSYSIFFLSISSIIGLLLIGYGFVIFKKTDAGLSEYLEFMDQVNIEVQSSISSGNLKPEKIISELESRGEGYKNLSSLVSSLTKSMIAAGVAILVSQLCIFHFIFNRGKAQQGRAGQPATAVELKPE